MIDWGCGDGQVLEKIDLHGASYLGVDVSETIVRRMRERFAAQPCYRFELADGIDRSEGRDLALSMDVLFHFPVDTDYDAYLSKLFGSADRFVLTYSTNFPGSLTARHVRRREFTADVAKRFPEWELIRTEAPLSEGLASFFPYGKTA
ncbi:class I SAM-dependent methyltransferase [Glycomyces buryatensis]|uniref:class I SAM-dependent methyltransferase n=1 Tax=Glycomyces buryatensis TaxID=2570927 RepID=UPI0014562BF1|nr:methyltransferase [Glycomyces buryatensis]